MVSRSRISLTHVAVGLFACVFLIQLYYFTRPEQPPPGGIKPKPAPGVARPPKPKVVIKQPVANEEEHKNEDNNNNNENENKEEENTNHEEENPEENTDNNEEENKNEENNEENNEDNKEENNNKDDTKTPMASVKYYLDYPQKSPPPFIAKTAADNFDDYVQRTKTIDSDWQMTGDNKMFVYSSHMNLGGNQVVSIVMHEGETHKWLKQTHFDHTKMKSPKERRIHCVFPDKTISLGKLEEWVFESEFLWLIKCGVSRQVQDTFIRKGRVNYLLVDAPESVTEASDIAEYVVANIAVTADDRSNPDQPINLMLCSSALSDAKAPYLKEWIEFYRMMGVEYFAIYDKSMAQNSKNVLDPYIKAGIVRIHKWTTPGYDDTHRAAQIPAHNDCLYRYKDVAQWLLYVDVDEFMFPMKHNSLTELLHEYDQMVISGIGVRGMLYGGPPGSGDLVMEKFTSRGNSPLRRHWRSKFIARAAYMSITAVHWGEGAREIDIDANTTLRMNHYYNAHGVRYPMDGEPTPVKDTSMPDKFASALKARLANPPGL